MDLNNWAKFYKFLCDACKNQHKKLLIKVICAPLWNLDDDLLHINSRGEFCVWVQVLHVSTINGLSTEFTLQQ